MILTDDAGRPIVPPQLPETGASIDDVIAYLRDSSAFNDRVASLASSAFSRRFRVKP